MNTSKPPNLAQQVRLIDNLSAFAKSSGIPYRTLVRIKMSEIDDYPMSTTTRIAIEAAMKRVKPKLKGAS